MKSLKKFLLLFLLLFILLSIFIFFLLSNTFGLNVLFCFISSFIPGFNLSSISGSLNNFIIHNLEYRKSGIIVYINRVHVSLDLHYLLYRKIFIRDLFFDEFIVRTYDSSAYSIMQKIKYIKQSSNFLHFICPFIVKHVVCHKMQLNFNDIVVVLHKCITGLVFQDNQFILSPINIEKITLSYVGAHNMKRLNLVKCLKSYDYKMFIIKKIYDFFFVFKIFSSNTPFNFFVEKIEVKNFFFHKVNSFVLNNFFLQGIIDNKHLELTHLSFMLSEIFFHVAGNIRLFNEWLIDMNCSFFLVNDAIKLKHIFLYIMNKFNNKSCDILDLTNITSFKFRINIALSEKNLPFRLFGCGNIVDLSMTNIFSYLSQQLSSHFNIRVKYFNTILKFLFSESFISSININLNTEGYICGLISSNIKLQTLNNVMNFYTTINCTKNISWNNILIIEEIDRACNIPKHSRLLSGKIISNGYLVNDLWYLDIPEISLLGKINNNICSIKGALRFNSNDRLYVPELSLVLGSNVIKIRETFKSFPIIKIEFNIPSINEILTHFIGGIYGTINFFYIAQSFESFIDIFISNLYWEEKHFSLQKASVVGRILYNCLLEGDITVNIHHIRINKVNVNQVTCNLTGNAREHSFQLISDGLKQKYKILFHGSIDCSSNIWSVIFKDIVISTSLGKLYLLNDLHVEYFFKLQKIVIGSNCWKFDTKKQFNFDNVNCKKLNDLRIFMSNFYICKFQFPLNIKISNFVIHYTNFSWRFWNTYPCIKLFFTINKIQIDRFFHEQMISTYLSELKFISNLQNSIIDITCGINTTENTSYFFGKIKFFPLQDTNNISGILSIKNMPLTVCSLNFNENITSRINVDLKINGSLQQPRLHGQMSLDLLSLQIDLFPINIVNSNLSLNFVNNNVKLCGMINTISGKLNITGNACWDYLKDWNVLIELNGSDVHIDIPLLSTSPNLSSRINLNLFINVILNITPQCLHCSGTICIPFGRINIKDFSMNQIKISSDEIIVDPHLFTAYSYMKYCNIPVNIAMKIEIGNNLFLDYCNIHTKLQGILKIEKSAKEIYLDGQLNINQGTFYAYGQNLIINRGALLFSGLFGVPYLNIEAIRNPATTTDGIIVGLRLFGLADHPKLEIFSIPFMSKQESISYLLYGQSLHIFDVDNNLIKSILIDLSLMQNDKLIGRMGNIFKISNFSLDTQGIGCNSRIILSGFIVPGLQIKYGLGMFDLLTTLTLRYCLSSSLYLETASGFNQTADILYQLEF